jgi:trans-L-3-hydroxyproline dehydratase
MQLLTVPNYGKIKYDLAYGGAFYAIINSKELGLELKYEFLDDIILLGKKIKELISKDVNCNHPLEPEMNDLYGIIFVDEIKVYQSIIVKIFASLLTASLIEVQLGQG